MLSLIDLFVILQNLGSFFNVLNMYYSTVYNLVSIYILTIIITYIIIYTIEIIVIFILKKLCTKNTSPHVPNSQNN